MPAYGGATYTATSGCHRAVKRLVTEAVLVAVDANAQAVTAAHFRLAFQRTNGPGSVLPNPYGGPLGPEPPPVRELLPVSWHLPCSFTQLIRKLLGLGLQAELFQVG